MALGPTTREIEEAIDARLASRRLTLADLAEAFGCSTRTVQRRCGEAFSAVLQARRALHAMHVITTGGTVTQAAAATGVSPDHLTKLFFKEFQVRPGELRRAVAEASTIRQWRKRELPSPGTPWYREQRRRWARIERRYSYLKLTVAPDTALAHWLTTTYPQVRRPDHRKAPYRDAVAGQRSAQRKRRSLQLDEALNYVAQLTRLKQAEKS